MTDSMFTYIQTHGTQILDQTVTHLWISILSLWIAVLIGVPAGYLAAANRRMEKWVSLPFQVLRVIPSLAVLVLLIPVMGTGVPPTVTALTILAVPPILLNTAVGFREVPEFMEEAASGIGMDEKEKLRAVRIPLALPMILAGIRTAMVEVIASATLSAKIGAGGLGEIIFTGLGLNRADLLVLGGALVAFLSLFCGFVFDRLCRLWMPYKYR